MSCLGQLEGVWGESVNSTLWWIKIKDWFLDGMMCYIRHSYPCIAIYLGVVAHLQFSRSFFIQQTPNLILRPVMGGGRTDVIEKNHNQTNEPGSNHSVHSDSVRSWMELRLNDRPGLSCKVG